MTDLKELWSTEEVYTAGKLAKPSLIGFYNSDNGCKLLNKHILNNSKIAVHCDVDTDGVGCGVELKTFFDMHGLKSVMFTINKDKIHGIQQKHVSYFNSKGVDLLIVVDSSTNELDFIRQLNCDVLVIDHHEIMEETLNLSEANHEKYIVNNMKSNDNNLGINQWLDGLNKSHEFIEEYKADARMSGGLVVYELLRMYCEAYGGIQKLEETLVYQWATVTLFSDVIQLDCIRNQWYVHEAFESKDIERRLSWMIGELDSYRGKLCKSFIQFKLSPAINRSIRAGASSTVLDIVLNHPELIRGTEQFKARQEAALSVSKSDDVYSSEYIMKNITDYSEYKNYTGVIATKISANNGKNTLVYTVEDGIASGSFRGRSPIIDYRKYFDEYADYIYAQGHAGAFGYRVKIEDIQPIMSLIKTAESSTSRQFDMTAGSISSGLVGKQHIGGISDMDEFKKKSLLWWLGIGNSRVSSAEEKYIICSSKDAALIEKRGKVYYYSVLGIECKAFDALTSPVIYIYAEFSNTIDIYVKNYNI